MKNFALAFTLLFFISAYSQSTNPNKNLNFNITSLNEEPIIDGNILDEDLWNSLLPLTDLKQIKPNYGASASENTEIRIAYTSKTLYVAVVCCFCFFRRYFDVVLLLLLFVCIFVVLVVVTWVVFF